VTPLPPLPDGRFPGELRSPSRLKRRLRPIWAALQDGSHIRADRLSRWPR